MRRDYHRWRSSQLGRDMELLQFGHAGDAYIVFPTSLGKFFEYEDRGMITALADKIEGGNLQLFCISTTDDETFYGKHLHPRVRIDRYLAWEQYLIEELVPFAASSSGRPAIGVTGCSFGAYHAFVMALRHPDIFTACVTMGGAFNLERFLDGYRDQDAYLLCPPWFLPGLADSWFLDRHRRNKWVLVTGERDICRADTEQAAALLGSKGIPHSLHVWGNGSEHDWPEWRRMASAYIP
jgi:esterase/lipase superfamily enzyme